MVDAGFAIGPRAWKRAKHGDEVQETRGRPSKAQSRDLIQKVVDLVSNNTQSSSIWLAKLGREARVLTASLHAMYWKSDLVADVKLTLFYQLVNEHCPWAIEARKETDVCDHCWLLRSTIQPGLVRLIKHARSALGTALPGYFAGFNMERLLAPENVPVSEDLLDEFATFINKHAERHQAERGVLKGRARVDLRSLEAKVEHALRWEKQVYSSYLWHVNCYERQNAAIAHLTEHLPPHGLLIWMDWKQNLSLPTAQRLVRTWRFVGPQFALVWLSQSTRLVRNWRCNQGTTRVLRARDSRAAECRGRNSKNRSCPTFPSDRAYCFGKRLPLGEGEILCAQLGEELHRSCLQ